MATLDVGQGSTEGTQETIGAVLLAGVAHVNEMIWYMCAVKVVVGEVLAGADVHATEHLARVGADNLAPQTIGHLGRQSCLARGRGAEDGDKDVTHRGR